MLERIQKMFRGEVLLHVSAGILAKGVPKRGVLEEFCQAVGHCLGVLRRDREAGDAVLQPFTDATDIKGDHRKSVCLWGQESR